MTEPILKIVTLTEEECSRLMLGASIDLSIRTAADNRIPEMVEAYLNGALEREIAEKFSMTPAGVSDILTKALTKEQRLSSRARRQARKRAIIKKAAEEAKANKEAVYLAAVECYLNTNTPVNQICKDFKISHGNFNNYLNKNNIPKRMVYRVRTLPPVSEKRLKELVKVYLDMSATDFRIYLREQGISHSQFMNYVYEKKIPCKNGKPRRVWDRKVVAR